MSRLVACDYRNQRPRNGSVLDTQSAALNFSNIMRYPAEVEHNYTFLSAPTHAPSGRNSFRRARRVFSGTLHSGERAAY